jgi:hypothetical protein
VVEVAMLIIITAKTVDAVVVRGVEMLELGHKVSLVQLAVELI